MASLILFQMNNVSNDNKCNKTNWHFYDMDLPSTINNNQVTEKILNDSDWNNFKISDSSILDLDELGG